MQPEKLKNAPTPASPSAANNVRPSSTGLWAIVVATFTLGGGLIFGWNWLRSVGIAPLGFVICAVGIWMVARSNRVSSRYKAPSAPQSATPINPGATESFSAFPGGSAHDP